MEPLRRRLCDDDRRLLFAIFKKQEQSVFLFGKMRFYLTGPPAKKTCLKETKKCGISTRGIPYLLWILLVICSFVFIQVPVSFKFAPLPVKFLAGGTRGQHAPVIHTRLNKMTKNVVLVVGDVRPYSVFLIVFATCFCAESSEPHAMQRRIYLYRLHLHLIQRRSHLHLNEIYQTIPAL
jgi:hypothetical protein